MRIYFGTIHLNRQVHGGALGFTSMLFAFAYAATAPAAGEAIARCYTARGCDVRKVDVSEDTSQEATKQDPAKYTFPEQIIDLPADVLADAFERQGIPVHVRGKPLTSQVSA